MWPVLAALAVWNLFALAVMGWDKRRAEHGGRRVPEIKIWLIAWLAGFPGVLVGMAAFRHKTRKKSFQWRLAVAIILSPAWVAVWLWLRAG